MPIPTREQRAKGLYPKTDKNSEFEKAVLRYYGFPEDYLPNKEEAVLMVAAYQEEMEKLRDQRKCD